MEEIEVNTVTCTRILIPDVIMEQVIDIIVSYYPYRKEEILESMERYEIFVLYFRAMIAMVIDTNSAVIDSTSFRAVLTHLFDLLEPYINAITYSTYLFTEEVSYRILGLSKAFKRKDLSSIKLMFYITVAARKEKGL